MDQDQGQNQTGIIPKRNGRNVRSTESQNAGYEVSRCDGNGLQEGMRRGSYGRGGSRLVSVSQGGPAAETASCSTHAIIIGSMARSGGVHGPNVGPRPPPQLAGGRV